MAGSACERNKFRLGSLRVAAAILAIVAIASACSCTRTTHQDESSPTTHPTTNPNRGAGTNGSQPAGTSNGGTQEDAPIDVNAMYGQPPMNADEAAIAKKVKEAILGDPRVTSKHIYVGVTHTFNIKVQVTIAGSVASQDEWTAAYNDAIKLRETGWAVGNSLSIDPSRSFTSAQAIDAPGPWSEPPASAKPDISLCPGLTVVTAIASQGDYESIKTIESVDAKGTRIKYSSESSQPWWAVPPARRNCEAGTPGCAITTFSTHRTVLPSDLDSAHKYDQIFVTDKKASETATGTTAIGTSAEVLRELKTKGESEITLCAGAEDSIVQTSDGQTHSVPGGCFAWMPAVRIKRVGNEPAHVHVLVDGTPVDLPAVHAQSYVLGYQTGGEERDEFFFLDDDRNPLTLKFRLGIGKVRALDADLRNACELAKRQGNLSLGGDPPPSCDLPEGGDRDVLNVVKISTRCEAPHTSGDSGASGGNSAVSAIEKALVESGKVDIYSIYFSFNSDKLREESQPTLKDIAEVMRRHPDWKLQVNGHTDGIGDDQFNLDLSKRRASAVKDALMKQYKLSTNGLATAGYGKSQPKDTNDTIEGRARNRRVELMRIG